MRAIILAIILGLCFSRSINFRHSDSEAQYSQDSFVATKQRPQLADTRNLVEPEEKNLIYKNQESDITSVESSDEDEDSETASSDLADTGRSLNEKTHNFKTNNKNTVISQERKEKKYTNVQLNNDNGSNHQEEYFFFSADVRKGRRKALGRNEPEEEISEEFCEQRTQKNVEFKHISHNIDADNIVKKFLSF